MNQSRHVFFLVLTALATFAGQLFILPFVEVPALGAFQGLPMWPRTGPPEPLMLGFLTAIHVAILAVAGALVWFFSRTTRAVIQGYLIGAIVGLLLFTGCWGVLMGLGT